MTEREIINNCKNILVTNLYEPKQNEIAIEVTLGKVSESKEEIVIANKSLFGKRVTFDNTCDKYLNHFASYISYFVVNESYDKGMSGSYSGNRIKEYAQSAFIDFCKKETFAFELNDDKMVKHFVLVSQNHTLNILTTSSFTIEAIIKHVTNS